MATRALDNVIAIFTRADLQGLAKRGTDERSYVRQEVARSIYDAAGNSIRALLPRPSGDRPLLPLHMSFCGPVVVENWEAFEKQEVFAFEEHDAALGEAVRKLKGQLHDIKTNKAFPASLRNPAEALLRLLYPSIRRLAEAVGVDVSQAAKVIRIADLPSDVLAAFRSPCDIQVNWATKLHAAVERDPDGVQKRARKLASLDHKKRDPKQVYAALTEEGGGVEPFHTPIEISGSKTGARATIATTKDGFNVRITGGVSATELEAALRRLLKA